MNLFSVDSYIKMSSPHLNNLIIIGCMLTYLSIIFLGLDTTLSSVAAFPYICTARAWILMAGFSLAFGAMFSKTWRVHSIFTDLKLNKKVIKDYQLFMVVGVLLFIDIAIITTWQIADPFYRETKQLEPKVKMRLSSCWKLWLIWIILLAAPWEHRWCVSHTREWVLPVGAHDNLC